MHDLKKYTSKLPVALMAVLLLVACGTPEAVMSVQIKEEAVRLPVGETAQLTAQVEVTGTFEKDVMWSSASESVATVDQAGLVTAVSVGVTTIEATSVADESKSGSVTVTVLAPPTNAGGVAPGDSSATVGGEAVATETSYEDGAMAVSVGDAEFDFAMQGAAGDDLPIHDGGVPRVTAGGSLAVSGSGLKPSTAVDVWLFSDPVWLGSPVTDETGSFSATFALPADLPAGSHTLSIEGNGPDGAGLSLQLGLEIADDEVLAEFAHCPAGSGWFVSSANGDDGATGSSIAEPVRSIQVALDGAVNGDVICIAEGVYDSAFVVDGFDGITIVGAGEATVVEPATAIATGIGHKYRDNVMAVVLVNDSTGVLLSDIKVTGADLEWQTELNAVVLWNASSGVIERLEVAGPGLQRGAQTGQGIAVDAGAGQSTDLDLVDVVISGWNKNGLDIVNGNGSTDQDAAGTIVVDVIGGTFTGAGATGTIGQNGILYWDRAGGDVSGTIDGVTIAEIAYTGDDASASGVLAFGNATLSKVANSVFAGSNEIYISNSTVNEIDATENNTFDGVLGSSANAEELMEIVQKTSGPVSIQ